VTEDGDRNHMVNESRRLLSEAKRAALTARELTQVVGRNQVMHALRAGYESARKRGLGAGPI